MVLRDESSWLPVRANILAVIREDIGLSSEILPVVSINTLSLIVLLVERTPFRLEVEHVKVSILFHLVNQSGFELLGVVGERTVVTVFAFVQVLGVLCAVF